MTAAPALRLHGVGKHIGRLAVLHGVDLELAQGQLLAILGASGAGKTTLLRLIAGLERPDAGSIDLGGERVAEAGGRTLPPERRRVGYLAQEGALFPHLSVADNIAFGLRAARSEQAATVARMLDLVSLPASHARRYPHQLSGGEQQRVALARALAPGPRLVLLDEPFSSLDAALRAELRETVAATLRCVDASAVLVTHDPAEALSLGDRVAVLMRGSIAQCDLPEAVYRRPADVEVARFVGPALLLDGGWCDGGVLCALGSLAVSGPQRMGAGALQVLVRPEQLALMPPGAPGSVAAQVVSVRYYGAQATVQLQLLGAEQLQVSAQVFGHVLPRLGARVGVAVTGPVCVYSRSTTLAAPQAVTTFATHSDFFLGENT